MVLGWFLGGFGVVLGGYGWLGLVMSDGWLSVVKGSSVLVMSGFWLVMGGFWWLWVFFYRPDTKAKISGIGVTPLTSSTVQWHTSITAPPLFEVYNGISRWFASVSSFSIWLDSLARSCRRCCCRSAAREGELREDGPLVTQLCRG